MSRIPIPETELQMLRSLVDAAGPGPWTSRHVSTDLFYVDGPKQEWVAQVLLGGGLNAPAEHVRLNGANAAFISAAREMVPRLLDEVEALRTALKHAVGVHSVGCDAYEDWDEDCTCFQWRVREALGNGL